MLRSGLLGCLIVGVVVTTFTGCAAIDSKPNATPARVANSASPTAEGSAETKIPALSETYCLKQTGVCFNYPKDYVVTSTELDAGFAKGVILSTPDGKKLLQALEFESGATGACVTGDKYQADIRKADDTKLTAKISEGNDFVEKPLKAVTVIKNYNGKYSVNQFVTSDPRFMKLGKHELADCPKLIMAPPYFGNGNVEHPYTVTSLLFGSFHQAKEFNSLEQAEGALKDPHYKLVEEILESVHKK